MAAECLVNIEQLVAEGRCPRNSILETANLGSLIFKPRYLSEVINMRRKILGEDKNVIHIDETEWNITQNLIYKALEHVTSIPKAKRHAQELKHPEGGDDGSLLDVLWSKRYPVISLQ